MFLPSVARFWLSTHKNTTTMNHHAQRRRYVAPDVTVLDTAAERGFAVTSSSIEDVGESDFGSGSADFWQ